MHIKKSAPGIIKRVRSGISYGFKSFLASIGLVGTCVGVFAATGNIIDFQTILYLAAFCFVVGLVTTIVKGSSNHLPYDVIYEETQDGQYEAGFCTRESLAEANALTKAYYGDEYVPDNVAESWRQKNPYAFVHILNKNKELCACFAVIGVEKSFMSQFIKGRLTDHELTSDDVLDYQNTKKSSTPYISGVVVKNPESPVGHRRTLVMIWSMLEYIKKMYGFRKSRDIYALAVSKPSENLLKKSGFELCGLSSQRKDGRNFYKMHLKSNKFDEIYARIGDYSKVCELKYDI